MKKSAAPSLHLGEAPLVYRPLTRRAMVQVLRGEAHRTPALSGKRGDLQFFRRFGTSGQRTRDLRDRTLSRFALQVKFEAVPFARKALW